ncbi:MAG: 4Fe-4S binding protein [Muribaculaceae bacterium]|nr:4Fe-4S binding protein [Muribaculaceae bacterium]
MSLKKLRITVAVVVITLITLLFLDFTGMAQEWFGWLAKVQFLPALLAMHIGVVAGLIILTLLFGRLYCSVICPLGIMQDIFGWLGKKQKRYRYGYSPAVRWLRYSMLVIMVILMVAGFGGVAALIAPYSSFGRIVQNLLSPVWAWCNNLLAGWAAEHDSYMFYDTEIWIRNWSVFGVAVATVVILAVLAWRNGRTYCNTICPVGTVLGFFSRFSFLAPVIDTSKCNSCGLCARNCKAACINSKVHQIDYSRCVTCFDCLDSCHKGAISYGRRKKEVAVVPVTDGASVDKSRRSFLTVTGMVTAAAMVKAADKTVDGGLAVIEDKKIPERSNRIVPPGAKGIKHLSNHCTACQLCVAACPNGVLRPSTAIDSFMQPYSSYERGYCRPECTRCSDVCPAGAIKPVSVEEKSSIQIGHACWVKENCIPLTDGVECGNCARHCPTGAIQMVPSDASDPDSVKIPVVNTEKCIGCGACENLCPARPFSAIYVEGHVNHRII